MWRVSWFPGASARRGIEGKIAAISYAREELVPFFGICLGMQCAVIEFARHVCGLNGANSREFDPHTPHPVIDLLPEQRGVTNLGGTMRLGAYPCRLVKPSRASEAYGAAGDLGAAPAPVRGQQRVPHRPWRTMGCC